MKLNRGHLYLFDGELVLMYLKTVEYHYYDQRKTHNRLKHYFFDFDLPIEERWIFDDGIRYLEEL